MTPTQQRIRMGRHHLKNLPRGAVPERFAIRWYEAGDMEAWLQTHAVADLYNETSAKLYRGQFGDDENVLAARQAFLCDPTGRPVGTATAWFDDDYHGERYGRLHWVAIEPRYQGRGLSKPLTAAVCRRLVELGHDRAYLTTSTLRIPAVKLYLSFGFEPEILDTEDERKWKSIRKMLVP